MFHYHFKNSFLRGLCSEAYPFLSFQVKENPLSEKRVASENSPAYAIMSKEPKCVVFDRRLVVIIGRERMVKIKMAFCFS